MNNKSVLITGASTGTGKTWTLYPDMPEFKVFTGVRKEEDKDALSN